MNQNVYDRAVAELARRRDGKVAAAHEEFKRGIAALEEVKELLLPKAVGRPVGKRDAEPRRHGGWKNAGATQEMRAWIMQQQHEFTTREISAAFPQYVKNNLVSGTLLGLLKKKEIVRLAKGNGNIPGIYRVNAPQNNNGAAVVEQRQAEAVTA